MSYMTLRRISSSFPETSPWPTKHTVSCSSCSCSSIVVVVVLCTDVVRHTGHFVAYHLAYLRPHCDRPSMQSPSSTPTSLMPPICCGGCVRLITRDQHLPPAVRRTSLSFHSPSSSLLNFHISTSLGLCSCTVLSSALQWHSSNRWINI